MSESILKGPRRPVMRYHGGKWRLAPWIIKHFPPHTIYVEPFCGAASVLMRKQRAKAEVLNDMDGDLCNVFRVLRNPGQARALEEQLRLTPFAREEFVESYVPSEDLVERARRVIVRSGMGFGTTAARKNKTGFRARSYCRNQTAMTDWATYPDQIQAFTDRLRAVLIENKDAMDLIPIHDSPETLFYIDPPYPQGTRSSITHEAKKRQYVHEMTDDDHRALAEVLRLLEGAVVLSGYACPLYDEDLYPDWARDERPALADGGQHRVEVLWTKGFGKGKTLPTAHRVGQKTFFEDAE